MPEPICVCANLPERFPDSNLTNVTPVAANIDLSREVGADGWGAWPCLVCGQWWRDGFGDDHALRKIAFPGPA